MKIAILKERQPYETRVAATPETVKKMAEMGCEVSVESGAGIASDIADDVYVAAGGKVVDSYREACKGADVVFKVQRPLLKGESPDHSDIDETEVLPEGAVLIGSVAYATHPEHQKAYAKRKLSVVAMEQVPRITRAQSMDVLSSQSNLAGYRAVIEAAAVFGKAFPMMMTAAGTVQPAKVLVLGAGVAGLQAIATAKRLGAIVSAFDVRAAAKEQVESLGAKFIAVEDTADAETAGGYAKEMGDDYKAKQQALLKEALKKVDVVITTALIPGKPAPRLLTAEMVSLLRPGSVIVDLAVEMGGNCDGSQIGKVVDVGGVKIVGYANMAGRLARDASPLYARNLLSFFQTFYDQETKKLLLKEDDDIIKGALKMRQGLDAEAAAVDAAACVIKKPAAPSVSHDK